MELTETYQALDETGGVHTIHVYAEVISRDNADGSTERTFGARVLETADGHAVAEHEDGTLEDLDERLKMRRIESP